MPKFFGKVFETVSAENIVALCGWSPFTGTRFSNSVHKTFVNGNLVYDNGTINEGTKGQRLLFNRG